MTICIFLTNTYKTHMHIYTISASFLVKRKTCHVHILSICLCNGYISFSFKRNVQYMLICSKSVNVCSNLYDVQHNTDNHSFYINVGAITAAKSWRQWASPNQPISYSIRFCKKLDDKLLFYNSMILGMSLTYNMIIMIVWSVNVKKNTSNIVIRT